MDLQGMSDRVAEVSQWIDQHNAHRDPEAAEWGRLAKIGEEFGEVMEAFIAQTGQNPRKPMDIRAAVRVDKELLDVAFTALAAWESRHGNVGQVMHAFAAHVKFVHERADAVRVEATK